MTRHYTPLGRLDATHERHYERHGGLVCRRDREQIPLPKLMEQLAWLCALASRVHQKLLEHETKSQFWYVRMPDGRYEQYTLTKRGVIDQESVEATVAERDLERLAAGRRYQMLMARVAWCNQAWTVYTTMVAQQVMREGLHRHVSPSLAGHGYFAEHVVLMMTSQPPMPVILTVPRQDMMGFGAWRMDSPAWAWGNMQYKDLLLPYWRTQ